MITVETHYDINRQQCVVIFKKTVDDRDYVLSLVVNDNDFKALRLLEELKH